MKLCVYGAGAIGGHLAARLAAGGAQVSVVARGAQLDGIRRHGLRVETPAGTLTARVQAAADPAELGPQDAILVTVKAPALASVAAAIGPRIGPATPVVFVMNGIPWWYFHAEAGARGGRRLPLVDPGDTVWRAIGPERAIGGVVYSACTVIAPGVVQVDSRRNRLIIGEPAGAGSSRAEAIASIIRSGGMDCEVTDQIRDAIWAKLALNIALGPPCVLTRSPPSAVLSDPTLATLVRSLVAEAVAIAQGMGCRIANNADAIIEQARDSHHKPSILQDLELGRPMEIDALYTTPLALAELGGVAAPVLTVMTALMRQVARAADLQERDES
jgi:2-dehydropantoate 2-reductase